MEKPRTKFTLADVPAQCRNEFCTMGEAVNVVYLHSYGSFKSLMQKEKFANHNVPGSGRCRVSLESLYLFLLRKEMPLDRMKALMKAKQSENDAPFKINKGQDVMTTGEVAAVLRTAHTPVIRLTQKKGQGKLPSFFAAGTTHRRILVRELEKFMLQEHIPLSLLHEHYPPHVAALMDGEEVKILENALPPVEGAEGPTVIRARSGVEIGMSIIRDRCQGILLSSRGICGTEQIPEELIRQIHDATNGGIPVGLWLTPDDDEEFLEDDTDFELDAGNVTAAALELQRILCWKTLTGVTS